MEKEEVEKLEVWDNRGRLRVEMGVERRDEGSNKITRFKKLFP